MVAVLCILAEQVQLPHGQVARRRRFYAHTHQLALEEFVGQLGEDAGPVARLAVIRHCAAMRMIGERLQPHLQHRVAAPALDMGDKANAAGIVFIARVVEALRRRETHRRRRRATGSHRDVYRFSSTHICVLPHLPNEI